MTINQFKKQLVCVFDDNLHTKVWHNIADWTIISLIIISSLEIFLSTFSGIHEKYGALLQFIDVFTTIVFTIEVTLRIWVADEIDPKYKGFRGRVRYCFSFYGLLDFLSTYPFYLSFFVAIPVNALKILRVARLLRVFRYMKSFKILGDAIASKKEELSISMAFLGILTVMLSFLLYFAEHDAQPELCENGWKTLVWAFAKYLGDPGKIADFQLVTFWGNLIGVIVGLLGIAIFAVPAGLIGSGFVEVIEEKKHKEEIADNTRKLHNAFERQFDRYTDYQVMPAFLSIAEIQARMGMTETEVFEAVDANEDFRIINVASTVPVANNPHDRLAVEHFPVNTSYGCKIDRGSKVTIFSMSNVADPVIGFFAYYLAKIGGFNYVSRELGETRPYKSFFSYSPDSATAEQEEMMADIDSLTSSDGCWTFTILAASGQNEPEYPTQVHFGYGGAKGDETLNGDRLTIKDIAFADKVMRDISDNLLSGYQIKSDRQRYHNSANDKLFVRHLKNTANVNSILIRVAWSVSCHDVRRIAVAKTIADTIKSLIEPDAVNLSCAEMNKKGLGVDDYEC